MLQSIFIENFRCFHTTQIKGFSRLNLIGGKNNSGKTSFLEALYCIAKPRNHEHILENRYGQLDMESRRASLFFNFNPNNTIKIEAISKDEKKYSLLLTEKTMSKFSLDSIIDNNMNSHLIFSKNRQFPTHLNLAAEFDELDIKGESKIIVDALQIVDGSIEEIKTYSSKPNLLYLRRQGEKNFIPLNDFGDALQKIVRYVITLTTFSENENPKYLLIDEIENGLHYTAQQEFWKMLFRLAEAYQIQLFATSHSLEMINAFKKVAYQTEFEQDAMYFELFKNPVSNQITANPFDMGMLHYDIIKNNPFRG